MYIFIPKYKNPTMNFISKNLLNPILYDSFPLLVLLTYCRLFSDKIYKGAMYGNVVLLILKVSPSVVCGF